MNSFEINNLQFFIKYLLCLSYKYRFSTQALSNDYNYNLTEAFKKLICDKPDCGFLLSLQT
jgi:hypothetical protein